MQKTYPTYPGSASVRVRNVLYTEDPLSVHGSKNPADLHPQADASAVPHLCYGYKKEKTVLVEAHSSCNYRSSDSACAPPSGSDAILLGQARHKASSCHSSQQSVWHDTCVTIQNVCCLEFRKIKAYLDRLRATAMLKFFPG
jgi:hypothetical protein